jgi:hypothetical protein
MALKRVSIPSPNYSSRGGSSVTTIVLHTAEGARTIESLGSYFQGNVSASSHAGADDKVNTVGIYVDRSWKSWTQANANPYCVSIELCGFASWSTSEWKNNHPNMLDNCAKWIAEEAAHFGIPITKLTASQAQNRGHGVCQHVDLGSMGGGHHDCGSGFPMDYVLDMARGGGGAVPATTEEDDMITSTVSASGSLHVFWFGTDRRTIWYRYQRKGETDWKDGGVLTKAGEDCAGISATVTATGTLELTVRTADADVLHTWQKANQSTWSGGQEGKQKAGLTPLPK